jgi:hypothetical protein
MFASVIEFQMLPGKMEDAAEFAGSLRSQLEQLDGLKQFITIDRGNDKALTLVIYESQAQWEAAGPKAQEILGKMAELVAAPPNREGCEVTVNEVF